MPLNSVWSTHVLWTTLNVLLIYIMFQIYKYKAKHLLYNPEMTEKSVVYILSSDNRSLSMWYLKTLVFCLYMSSAVSVCSLSLNDQLISWSSLLRVQLIPRNNFNCSSKQCYWADSAQSRDQHLTHVISCSSDSEGGISLCSSLSEQLIEQLIAIMKQLILFLVTLMCGQTLTKRWRDGPSVDPGVFVITHIRY
jgi:hypothetical protein